MKVAVTCPASFPAIQFGGIMFLAHNIAKLAGLNGHEPAIYTTDLDFQRGDRGKFNRGLPREGEHDGVRIKRFHAYTQVKLFFVSPGIYGALVRDRPDIIHAVGIRSFQSLAAALASKKLGVPLVVSDQGGLGTNPSAKTAARRILYRLHEPAVRMIIKQATRIIAANEFERDIFRRYGSPSKIRIVRNGIDPAEFAKRPEQGFAERLGIQRYVLFLSRLSYWKGPDLLLRATRILKDAGKLGGCKVVLLGSDSGFGEQIAGLIDELGLRDEALLVRNPPRADVIAAIHGCEFMALPTREEVSPGVPVEGFLCKKTSVSSRIGGVRDVIGDGRDGLLFEPEDYRDLADKIRILLEDPGLRDRLAGNGNTRALTEYSNEAMARTLDAVYAECMADAATSAAP